MLLILAGCSTAKRAAVSFEVHDPYAFEAAQGGTAAAYGVLVNGRDSAVVLDSITSSASLRVSMHTTREENGLLVMVPIETLVIPAHDSMAFAPGGSHLMLEQLRVDLKIDDRTDLTFWLAHHPPVTISVPVRAYGS